MSKELNLEKEKENLIQERNYLLKENIQLETIINSQTKREKNEEKLKEIEDKLLEVHIKLLRTDKGKEEMTRNDEKDF